MSEHDEPEAVETDDEVEAHGLKEIAVTGLSAAALIAGAGDAIAATTPGHAPPRRSRRYTRSTLRRRARRSRATPSASCRPIRR